MTKPKLTEKIEYEKVAGHSLMIYPPYSWFDNSNFVVFVGGCGVGRRKTLAAAERLLAAEAMRHARELLEAAGRDVAHYTRECRDFVISGLKRKKTK